MRISSRAVIVEDDQVLVLFRRFKKGDQVQEYYTFAGGGQEEGETLQQTVVRELNEELGVVVEVLGYLGCDDVPGSRAHFFACKIISGTPQLGGEELQRMNYYNYYEPMYIKLKDVPNINLYGAQFISKAINKQYSQQPK